MKTDLILFAIKMGAADQHGNTGTKSGGKCCSGKSEMKRKHKDVLLKRNSISVTQGWFVEKVIKYHRFLTIRDIPDRINSMITIFFTILSSSTEAPLIPPYNPSNAKGIKIQTRFRISAVNSPRRL